MSLSIYICWNNWKLDSQEKAKRISIFDDITIYVRFINNN